MYQERVIMVNLLKYVGGGIEDRENSIKERLAQIAALEMEKGNDEDLLSEQTLKTIEIVNIADIATEKVNFERQIMNLQMKLNDLTIQEGNILREKQRREDKKRSKEQMKKEMNNKA